ncbi:DUF7527 domain-containing protein [Halorussus sp. AFM4]|uniref:DUF7527 domain-containing protein n=1 Tax=Halorussus sp. AFM4 TaxID=3421651 RepID=UPI003EBACE93
METRTVEQVESWQTRSFRDGFAGLRELSDGEFSGAVRAGGAWLFMLNGRIIGVYEGSLDDFEDAEGTAYAAPHPSLPLLFSMQERGGETQAKYYTNDTPLSEVDSTLTSGKFTGFIELSENVLSGDYYVAYYGGRSMSVAFVGASEQVVTGDEAFERADDEVGIYEVTDVDIEVTDVPEPDEPEDSPSAGGSAGASGSASDGGDGGTGGSDEATGGSPTSGSGSASTAAGGAGAGPGGESPTADAAATDAETGTLGAVGGQSAAGAGSAVSQSTADGAATEPADPAPDRDAEPSRQSASRPDPGQASPEPTADGRDAAVTESEADAGTRPTDAAERAAGPDARAGAAPSAGSESAPAEAGAGAGEPAGQGVGGAPERTTPQSAGSEARAEADDGDGDDADAGSAFDEEEAWREATTIPSLDPDLSEGPDDAEAGDESGPSPGAGPTQTATGSGADAESASVTDGRTAESDAARPSASRSGASGRSESASGRPGSGAASTDAGAGSPSGHSDASGGDDESGARVRELRSRLDQREQQVQQLKKRLSNVESERNEYKRERDALRQEVERLEAKLESAGSNGSGSGKRRLDRAQAFDGTNLFVRYESKGQATLDEAAEGKVDADEVNANLRLEHHTQFEAEDVEVAGESFESFLTDSFEYRFVSWVVEELLYEIRDTGHRNALKDLYESIPKVDRVDLHGSVSAGATDEDTRQESFDVIMRDRMGNPLLLADLNGSRDPTTGEMMGSLVDASSGVAHAHDELAGAFQVTESFFEPEALETAESATSGGFLSREKRQSFVKLSRKRGYHLCLVESRSGGFHLNVPEL